ncbi:hypothetical protein ACFL0W_00510 [Nanoarchaeota archaeon]
MKKLFIFTILILILSISAIAEDGKIEAVSTNHETKLTLFYSDTCPHCHEEIKFLTKLQEKYPELIIEQYEISQEGAVQKMTEMAAQHNFKPRGVPLTFIDSDYFIGFDNEEGIGKKIEAAVLQCVQEHADSCEPSDKNLVEIPLFGEIDTSKMNLPLFTVIVGGLDGFNPCAMWVLMFLLSLLIYAKSRKRMLLIGGIFVITSGVIYFLFMTAWLNFFLFVGYATSMRIVIAIIAITAGLINLKELFWFKKGISLMISDKHKLKAVEKMRKIVHEQSLSLAITGTIALAIFVNFIELLCTAGLPAIYTNILTLNNLHWVSYYLYLVLYNIIYVLPLMIIVTIFSITMGRHKFTKRQGQILKLISGILMLALGLIMLLRPELLSFG